MYRKNYSIPYIRFKDLCRLLKVTTDYIEGKAKDEHLTEDGREIEYPFTSNPLEPKTKLKEYIENSNLHNRDAVIVALSYLLCDLPLRDKGDYEIVQQYIIDLGKIYRLKGYLDGMANKIGMRKENFFTYIQDLDNSMNINIIKDIQRAHGLSLLRTKKRYEAVPLYLKSINDIANNASHLYGFVPQLADYAYELYWNEYTVKSTDLSEEEKKSLADYLNKLSSLDSQTSFTQSSVLNIISNDYISLAQKYIDSYYAKKSAKKHGKA